MKGKWLKN